MSLRPDTEPGREPAQDPAAVAGAVVELDKRRTRVRRLWGVCFALFTFEIGLFLLVFPWMDSWSLNHLPSFLPAVRTEFQDLWDDPYFKGAVSGLGVLNLYLAFSQAVSLLRGAKTRSN